MNQAPNMTVSVCALVPCQTFVYRQKENKEHPQFYYKLDAILPSKVAVEYHCSEIIERNALSGDNLKQLLLFNDICIPEVCLPPPNISLW